MPKPQRLPLTNRQQLTRLQNILNLPPIQLNRRQLIHLLLTKSLPDALTHTLQKLAPHMFPAFHAQALVLQTEMDAWFEGAVDIVDAVGSEEEETLEVFERAEEDGDEFVAFEVMGGAGFEEDVGFVEEEDRVPFRGHEEDVFEGLFDAWGVGAEVAGGHHVESVRKG